MFMKLNRETANKANAADAKGRAAEARRYMRNIDMKKSVLSRYHVNEVPIILKPMFYLYGYGIPFVLFLYFLFVYLTSKIVITGNKVFKDNPNYIICFWHTFICLYFTVFRKNRHQVWLQHPTWYMKPSW